MAEILQWTDLLRSSCRTCSNDRIQGQARPGQETLPKKKKKKKKEGKKDRQTNKNGSRISSLELFRLEASSLGGAVPAGRAPGRPLKEEAVVDRTEEGKTDI